MSSYLHRSNVCFHTSRTGSEIAYESVTEENVVGWIKTAIGADQVADYERLMHENLIYIHKNAAGITTSGVPSSWAEPEEYIEELILSEYQKKRFQERN